MPGSFEHLNTRAENWFKADEAGVALPSPFSKPMAEASGGPCACLGTGPWEDRKHLQKLQKRCFSRLTGKMTVPEV